MALALWLEYSITLAQVLSMKAQGVLIHRVSLGLALKAQQVIVTHIRLTLELASNLLTLCHLCQEALRVAVVLSSRLGQLIKAEQKALSIRQSAQPSKNYTSVLTLAH
jgi:hypothetical protein